MKKVFLFISVFVLATTVMAQVKPKPASKAPLKTVTSPLKTKLDTLSYAFGQSVAGQLKNVDVKDLNYAVFRKGVEDGMKSLPPLCSPESMNAALNAHFMGEKMKEVNVQKEKGKKFLDENKKRPGIIVLPSGLQYEILKAGTGVIPKETDTIVAHYAGSLIDGKEFQSSYKMGQPITRHANGLIRGWTEALIRMPVGSKWKLYIPSDLGYGDYGMGQDIPGGATLIFEMELLEVIPDKSSNKPNN